MKGKSQRFVLCLDNTDYEASLIVGKVYRVLPDAKAVKDDLVRIIDESGEDYLYPTEYFVMITLPRQKARALNKSVTRLSQPSA